SGEDGGCDDGLGLGGLKKLRDVVSDPIDGGEYGLVIRKAGVVYRLESFKGAEVRAVGGFGGGIDDDAGEAASVRDEGAFGVEQEACIGLRHDGDVGGKDAGVILETGGVGANPFLPEGLVELELRRNLLEGGRFLDGKIVGIVFGGDADLGVRLDAN